MIFENSLNMSVVKLFMKNIRRQDFRISLKNISRISCVVELGIIKNDTKIKVKWFLIQSSIFISIIVLLIIRIWTSISILLKLLSKLD